MMNAAPQADAPRRVFVVWLRPPMSANRAASLELIRRHVGVETIVLTDDDLPTWVVGDAPLHPAFGHLSAVHQADYLRCYLMHHHGGGYVDLKPLTTTWASAFDRLNATPGAVALGYREIGPQWVASMGIEDLRWPRCLHSTWWQRRWLQANYWRLMGNSAFIFRPRSALTTAWWTEMTRRLDGFATRLAACPARHPRDHAGFPVDGRPSGYPVPWSALLGDVLQPLALRQWRRLLLTLPPPRFTNYH
jgi:hypothetical protein